MKLKLLSLYLVFCFYLFLPMYSYSQEITPQTETSMKSYIMKLETQLQLSQQLIVTLEKDLMKLENYKNNLTSYNVSTTKLTEKEKNQLEEEKLMRQQLEKLTQQLQTQLTEAMKQSTIITEKLIVANKQVDDAKALNDITENNLETQKKKTKLWQILSGVFSAFAFLVGGYLGINLPF